MCYDDACNSGNDVDDGDYGAVGVELDSGDCGDYLNGFILVVIGMIGLLVMVGWYQLTPSPPFYHYSCHRMHQNSFVSLRWSLRHL